jgi:uncharacterized OsmC-like protein
MHNVNVEALNQTVRKAGEDPSVVRQQTQFNGEWNVEDRAPFRGTIRHPGGETTFHADFPRPMGGTAAAPNPLAHCFCGGLACYAMTFAQEAGRQGVEIGALRAHARADIDRTRAPGLSDRRPVEQINWQREIDAGAEPDKLGEPKRRADEHCPGVFLPAQPGRAPHEPGSRLASGPMIIDPGSSAPAVRRPVWGSAR